MDMYLRFWGVACYLVTAWLFFVKEVCWWMRHWFGPLTPLPQDKEDIDVKEMGVKRVYLTIWDICKLKRECTCRNRLGL